MLLFAIVVCAILAVGSGPASATAADIDCPGTDSTVVGDIDGEWVDGEEQLYEGSTFDIAYCNDGSTYEGDWLTDDGADGFEIRDEPSSTTEGVYTVAITGEAGTTVAFDDYVTLNDVESGLTVTVAGEPTGEAALAELEDEHAAEYLEARRSLENATTALNETTAALEEGDADIAAAEEDLDELNTTYGNMNDRADALNSYLLAEAEAGNESGAIGALAAVQADASQQREETDDAVERYQTAVETERSAAQSTVRMTTLGSLAAGLVVGVAAGAAVPLVAARRVEETMKLSRNVSYDRKTALVPILVGLALAVAGGALLVTLGGVELLEVIR
ncbi:hypothetical protein [Natrinema versiforme]|uniref:Uncharacterized protein n=1 Tax=Natrinema versiforme JCM 10478 TaxID=1227496 RepID=L9XWK7_9EURY|nr:hypothetical protein [Natrinema versiforme]ELY65897.1 hypothetical protein C489_13588 [Natrinema versiforme JCM 10478]